MAALGAKPHEVAWRKAAQKPIKLECEDEHIAAVNEFLLAGSYGFRS